MDNEYPRIVALEFTISDNNDYWYLVWDLVLDCPISNIISEKAFIVGNPEDRITICDYDSPDFEQILSANKAGPNGEWISWKEILDLYA
jgi:hypothetical protein